MSGILQLLTNEGSSSGVDIVSGFQFWHGGPGDFVVWGDLGGGTIHLDLTPNLGTGTNVICITGTQLNVSGVVKFILQPGFHIRAVLQDTDATSSGVFAEVF